MKLELIRDLRTAIDEYAKAEYERATATGKSFLAKERIQELTAKLAELAASSAD